MLMRRRRSTRRRLPLRARSKQPEISAPSLLRAGNSPEPTGAGTRALVFVGWTVHHSSQTTAYSPCMQLRPQIQPSLSLAGEFLSMSSIIDGGMGGWLQA